MVDCLTMIHSSRNKMGNSTFRYSIPSTKVWIEYDGDDEYNSNEECQFRIGTVYFIFENVDMY